MAEDAFGIVGTVQGGSFRVEEVVAEGGFAVVYRAYHGAFRANVALKCLKVPGTLSASDQARFLESFREEAELLFRLSSTIPNIVRPLHVGTLSVPGQRFVPFIAIEWLDGQTLDAIVTRRALDGEPPLELGAVMRLLKPVANALDRAHKFPGPNGVVSIVHRDLKPENLFVADVMGEQVVKILDFGIAKVKSATTQIAGRQSSNDSGLAAFTPAYGAPEQWLPKRFGQTGPWTDVWGLALTMVECVCGHTPLDGDQAAVMGAALDPEQRPTPRREGVRVSDAVEAVFTQALAVDPRDRFHDVGAFWTALESAMEEAAAPALTSAPVARVGVGGGAVSLPPDPQGRTLAAKPAGSREPAAGVVPDLVIEPTSARRRAESGAQGGASERGGATEAVRDERRPPALAGSARGSQRGVGAEPMSYMFGNNVEEADAFLEPAAGRLDVADLDPMPPGVASVARVRPRPRPAAPASAAVAALDLRGPIKMLIFAVLLTVGDVAYTHLTGDVLRVGPARTFWLAGPLAVLGIGMLVSRLLLHDSGD